MGYEKHDTFTEPADENESVWRYVDFTKLVSMLSTKALHFTRIDTFKDPFEGSASVPSLRLVHGWYLRMIEKEKGLLPQNVTTSEQLVDAQLLAAEQARKNTAVNCWHLNRYESAAMWSLYLKSDEGIAIRSTYEKLKNSFSKAEETIYVGQVKYIDYRTEIFHDPANMFSNFLHKRRSFEHEREVRALVRNLGRGHPNPEMPLSGMDVAVDLDHLVEEVIIAPGTAQWFSDVVTDTISRFGFDWKVRRSDLLDKPY